MGFSLWVLYDNLVYLAKVKLIGDARMAHWDKRSARFWFLGILCALLMNVRKIVENGLMDKKTPRTEYLQLVRNTLDLAVPGFKLEMPLVRALVPNKGLVGLSGVVSSLISLYLLWPPLKK